MAHKNKHYYAVLYFTPYLEENELMKPWIPIYRFSDRVTSKDIH